MTPPDGYKKLPKGIRCRCLRLWREADGNHWCCNLGEPRGLAEMPSSLNDACRKLDTASEEIAEAADIIDMLKTVIETELVKLGLPMAAAPTSALGRARAFILKYGRPSALPSKDSG